MFASVLASLVKTKLKSFTPQGYVIFFNHPALFIYLFIYSLIFLIIFLLNYFYGYTSYTTDTYTTRVQRIFTLLYIVFQQG